MNLLNKIQVYFVGVAFLSLTGCSAELKSDTPHYELKGPPTATMKVGKSGEPNVFVYEAGKQDYWTAYFNYTAKQTELLTLAAVNESRECVTATPTFILQQMGEDGQPKDFGIPVKEGSLFKVEAGQSYKLTLRVDGITQCNFYKLTFELQKSHGYAMPGQVLNAGVRNTITLTDRWLELDPVYVDYTVPLANRDRQFALDLDSTTAPQSCQAVQKRMEWIELDRAGAEKSAVIFNQENPAVAKAGGNYILRVTFTALSGCSYYSNDFIVR